MGSFRLLLKLLTKTFLIDDINYTDRSVQSAIEKISLILSAIPSKKKIVRIGDGSLALSYEIAKILKDYFKDKVIIEIVDEYGTSIRQGSDINRRGIRDISSARKIAFRNGRVYNK